MRAYLSVLPLGVMALDDSNILVAFKKFDLNPEAVARKLLDISNGKQISEIEEIANDLSSNGYSVLVCESAEICDLLKKVKVSENLKIITEKNNEVSKKLRADFDNNLASYGGLKNTIEINIFLNKVSLIYTREKIRRSAERRDMLIIQAVEALNDLDKSVNLNSSRLREWYSLYFPELNDLVSSHESYSKIVGGVGLKDNYDVPLLEKIGIPSKRAEIIVNSLNKTIGAEFMPQDISIITLFANMINAQYEARTRLEEYIDQAMEEVAPNIKSLAGSVLGARLISLAGGLANLSKMPASTVQVLGAEKALFTYLKSGDRPPKHGIIFQHAWIHNAPKWQRGKIARALAGKLSIASRLDYYSANINQNILSALDKRMDEIKRKYEKPSEKTKKPRIKPKTKFKRKSLSDKKKRRLKGK